MRSGNTPGRPVRSSNSSRILPISFILSASAFLLLSLFGLEPALGGNKVDLGTPAAPQTFKDEKGNPVTLLLPVMMNSTECRANLFGESPESGKPSPTLFTTSRRALSYRTALYRLVRRHPDWDGLTAARFCKDLADAGLETNDVASLENMLEDTLKSLGQRYEAGSAAPGEIKSLLSRIADTIEKSPVGTSATVSFCQEISSLKSPFKVGRSVVGAYLLNAVALDTVRARLALIRRQLAARKAAGPAPDAIWESTAETLDNELAALAKESAGLFKRANFKSRAQLESGSNLASSLISLARSRGLVDFWSCTIDPRPGRLADHGDKWFLAQDALSLVSLTEIIANSDRGKESRIALIEIAAYGVYAFHEKMEQVFAPGGMQIKDALPLRHADKKWGDFFASCMEKSYRLLIGNPLSGESGLLNKDFSGSSPALARLARLSTSIGEATKGFRKQPNMKGGGRGLRQAIEWSLDWLARHQDPEGFWDADGFAMQCMDEPCNGKGRALNDVGVTGLALLSFMGAGSTPLSGMHGDVVRRGVKHLCDIQLPADGRLVERLDSGWMYNHAIGSLALVEAYGLTRLPTLKRRAQKALDFIHRSKNPGKAWRYNIGETDPVAQNDVSVTSWMVICLATGKSFGLSVDPRDLEDALLYLDEMTDPATGRTGYNERGMLSSREAGDENLWPYTETEAITAAAMLARCLAGHVMGDTESCIAKIESGAKLLRSHLPEWNVEKGSIDFYYWYYGSYSMYQLAGKDWRIWKTAMEKAVVENQRKEGCERGSWDPQVDPWGDSGGRVYATAMNTLCLEVFFRYEVVLGGR